MGGSLLELLKLGCPKATYQPVTPERHLNCFNLRDHIPKAVAGKTINTLESMRELRTESLGTRAVNYAQRQARPRFERTRHNRAANNRWAEPTNSLRRTLHLNDASHQSQVVGGTEGPNMGDRSIRHFVDHEDSAYPFRPLSDIAARTAATQNLRGTMIASGKFLRPKGRAVLGSVSLTQKDDSSILVIGKHMA